MKVLPLLVFAAAAGMSSGVMSFRHSSQLSYDNAVLALRVHHLEREITGLHKERSLQEGEAAPQASVGGDGGRPLRPAPHRSSSR